MLNRGKRTFYGQKSKGFALPTVLIASIVMFLVLLASVTATVSVRTSLNDQYYNRMAQNAADAGLEYAKACVASTGSASWGTLSPNINCDGTPNTASEAYVMGNDNFRTTFEVNCDGACDGPEAVHSLVSVGRIELLRKATEGPPPTFQVWRVYSTNTDNQSTTAYGLTLLVVAGGGGGGYNVGGGGGGGGVLFKDDYRLFLGKEYSVSVGSGGSPGVSGNDSVFSDSTEIRALAGGAGGIFDCIDGEDGGSGGGGGGTWPAFTTTLSKGGEPFEGQGSKGGDGTADIRAGGGGGGAGGAGENAKPSEETGGKGGIGSEYSISGESKYYGGGGGGGGLVAGSVDSVKSGGGGKGADRDNIVNAENGKANTGGGGGGHGYKSGYNGGSGGSGIVIISFPSTYKEKIIGPPGGETCEAVDLKTVCSFKTPGDYTFSLD